MNTTHYKPQEPYKFNRDRRRCRAPGPTTHGEGQVGGELRSLRYVPPF